MNEIKDECDFMENEIVSAEQQSIKIKKHAYDFVCNDVWFGIWYPVMGHTRRNVSAIVFDDTNQKLWNILHSSIMVEVGINFKSSLTK